VNGEGGTLGDLGGYRWKIKFTYVGRLVDIEFKKFLRIKHIILFGNIDICLPQNNKLVD
jgi:hypothetical protein